MERDQVQPRLFGNLSVTSDGIGGGLVSLLCDEVGPGKPGVASGEGCPDTSQAPILRLGGSFCAGTLVQLVQSG